jgi:hypothetical protein
MARLPSAYTAALCLCYVGYGLVVVGALQVGKDPTLGLSVLGVAFALVVFSTYVAGRARGKSGPG